jgi:hypothetical protein
MDIKVHLNQLSDKRRLRPDRLNRGHPDNVSERFNPVLSAQPAAYGLYSRHAPCVVWASQVRATIMCGTPAGSPRSGLHSFRSSPAPGPVILPVTTTVTRYQPIAFSLVLPLIRKKSFLPAAKHAFACSACGAASQATGCALNGLPLRRVVRIGPGPATCVRHRSRTYRLRKRDSIRRDPLCIHSAMQSFNNCQSHFQALA